MSHVLHFWEGPAPDGPEDAAALIASDGGGELERSARFSDFAAALKKKHPDAHALEARGKDGDKAVWSDSPLTGETQGPFLVLGLRLEKVDRKVIHFIVKTAGTHGLHTYDSQTGELWRKDDAPPPAERPKPPRLATPDVPMSALHRFARAAALPPAADPGPRPTIKAGDRLDFGQDEAQRIVIEPIARHLASCGWKEGKGWVPGQRILWREIGPARQVLCFFVNGAANAGYSVNVAFHFEIPQVQEALFAIEPRWRRKRAGVRGKDFEAYGDVHCKPWELFGAEGEAALQYRATRPYASVPVYFRRDMAWWSETFVAWYGAHAEPLLGACTGLVTLNRFVNNRWRLAHGMEHSEWDLMSTLALARMAPHEDVPWVAVLTGVRFRADRLAMDEKTIERTIAALEGAYPERA